jgi:hypothetical protein
MKKIFFIFFLGILFFPLISLALNKYTITDINTGVKYTATYDGFVPCGRTPTMVEPPAGGSSVVIDCTLCHLLVMIDGIVDFVLLKLVPPIATLGLIFAGISFYGAMGNPEKYNRAKTALLSIIIGLAIIYASWVIINEVFVEIMGMASWVGFGEGWFRINCPVISTITW